MSALDTEHFRQRLQEERHAVLEAIENIHHENPGSMSDETEELSFQDNHLGDAASGTLDREIDYSLEENSEQVLAQIDEALKRIDDGTFGVCSNCGQQIAEERLEARPWATLCIDCKRKEERR